MKLPNAEKAVIRPEKLRDYLLSPERSGGKAGLFARLGYTEANWERLGGDLYAMSLAADAEELPQTRFGKKFMIRAKLTGPSGVTESLVSVWIIEKGRDQPRFVTAYRDRRPA